MMFYCGRLTFAFSRLFPDFGSKIITELSSPEIYHALKVTSYLTEELILTLSHEIATGFSKKIFPQTKLSPAKNLVFPLASPSTLTIFRLCRAVA
jgi:hypothetical protein